MAVTRQLRTLPGAGSTALQVLLMPTSQTKAGAMETEQALSRLLCQTLLWGADFSAEASEQEMPRSKLVINEFVTQNL